jgi:PIN domain nuclease of toxin-antitoxin system
VILLDTHVLFWMGNDSKRLSRRAREAIHEARRQQGQHSAGIAVATITLWELAWLAQNSRIAAAVSVESFVRELAARVILRPVTPEIAGLSVRLPDAFPKDPVDRLIAATAIVEGMPLVTADIRIRQSKVVETVW